MTHRFPLTRQIARDREGAVIIEFAILGPLVLGLMIGVFQIGLAMQAYNSMRSVAGEAARYAAVEYQKGNSPDNNALETQAIAIATADPYILDPSVVIDVSDAAIQRVTGAREMTITITYTVPAFLPFFDWASPTLTHSRPIFVLD
jgi:Flp pilus assembly protein TadG